jgi:DnaJ-class molecular chaperone
VTVCAPRPIGWQADHTATAANERTTRWLTWTRPCPTCWEQGRIVEYLPDGGGMFLAPCPRCDGDGRVAKEAPR